MREFVMCDECRAEYETPSDRRFHAQPIACPRCGPKLELWDATGRVVAAEFEALTQAVRLLKDGNVLALKGLGGFQLLVLAGDEKAVQRLRLAKNREAKPFAVMVPNLEAARAITEISPAEQRLLTSPEAPIVLLRARAPGTGMDIAPGIAPGNPWLGLMLPYTPLHHLLLQELGLPVVATSGNLKDEPICIDEREALVRLRGIADGYLTHNRPIVRPIDDSVARVVMRRELLLRRARGYAPLPIHVAGFDAGRGPVLAVGAHLKNTVAVQSGSEVFLSQHVGDLETMQAYDAFQAATRDLPEIYQVQPVTIAADKHPDYLSSRWAAAQDNGSNSPRVVRVQHHVAHVLSCLAENELAPPALGVAWDGTGCGEDGTVWGGEFFHIEEGGSRRVARIRPFFLPGGERAVKEPRRSAAGLLYAAFGEPGLSMLPSATRGAFTDAESHNLLRVLGSGLNCPSTSSAGRLFDAVASLAGLRQHSRFEGQSAMELEFSLPAGRVEKAYPMEVRGPCAQSAGGGAGLIMELNWEPMLREILEDVGQGIPASTIAARFHNGLVQGIVQVASKVGERRVVLSGGCFQNCYLLEQSVTALGNAGFKPYWHQRVPPNDGGISLGQVVAAQWGNV
jgi:hydrogenase maturation protein HypF